MARDNRVEAAAARFRQDYGHDIDAMTAQLGAEIIEKPMAPSVRGLSHHKDKRIILNSELPPDLRRFTLAHELGHFAIRLGYYGEWDYRTEEWAANRLGAEFLLPVASITPSNVIEIQRSLPHQGIPELVLAMQLLRLRRGDYVVRCNEGTIVCTRCGPQAPSLGFGFDECYAYRSDPPSNKESALSLTKLVAAYRAEGF